MKIAYLEVQVEPGDEPTAHYAANPSTRKIRLSRDATIWLSNAEDEQLRYLQRLAREALSLCAQIEAARADQ